MDIISALRSTRSMEFPSTAMAYCRVHTRATRIGSYFRKYLWTGIQTLMRWGGSVRNDFYSLRSYLSTKYENTWIATVLMRSQR